MKRRPHFDSSCAEVGKAGTASLATPSAAGGTAAAESKDDAVITVRQQRHRVGSATITVTHSFPKDTASAVVLNLVADQATEKATFTLADGTSKTSEAAVAGSTVVTTDVQVYVKAAIKFKAGSVSTEDLAQAAETINALPAADTTITVGGVIVQPEEAVIASETTAPSAAVSATPMIRMPYP